MNLASLLSAFNLSGQTALITGGGTGLGLGAARCLTAAGAKVVLVGRRMAPLHEACTSLGREAFALQGDVTDRQAAPSIVREAERLAGPITLLLNNAGIHLKKPAINTSDTEFASVMQTHVFGAFSLTREVVRRMIERKSGCVLFTVSVAAFVGLPLIVAYSAAKSAQVGMIRTLATEWGPHGIRVNGIAPGWISSDMLDQALRGDEPRKAKIISRTALGRFGEADDIGWAAVYLASPAAKFVTGMVLAVDGGAIHGF